MGFTDNFIRKTRTEEDSIRNNTQKYSDMSKPEPRMNGAADTHNVAVYNPQRVEDVQVIIDYLIRSEPVLVKMHDMPNYQDAQRLLDFLSGATYALEGGAKKVADNIYLITPKGVSIVGGRK